MSLEVYEMAHSPYCIPIRRALDALGVAFDRIEVPNWDRSAVIRASGGRYYQVPLLVHDGRAVFESTPDSQDVAHYVDETFAGGRLFPAQHAGLHQIVLDHIDNEVEGVTFKLVDPFYVDSIEDVVNRVHLIRHKERKFGRGCVEQWRASRNSLADEARRLLTRFDAMVRQRPYLFGDAPVYADFALFGILGNLTYRNFNSLPDALDALKVWQTRLAGFKF